MNHFEVTFVTAPVSEDTADNLLEQDIYVHSLDRLTHVSVNVCADHQQAAIKEGYEKLRAAGLTVRRLHLDLVNASQIATRADVSRAAVSGWTKDRATGCPFPIEHTYVSGPVWCWADVNAWMLRTRKPGADSIRFLNADDVQVGNTWIRQQATTTTVGSSFESNTSIGAATALWAQMLEHRLAAAGQENQPPTREPINVA